MYVIKVTYFSLPVPTGIVRFVASKPLLDGSEQVVATQEYGPPHLNPRDAVIPVPTPSVHFVRIYEAPDSASEGVLKSFYTVTPSLDGPIVPPPLEIVVGGGRAGRDPEPGTTEIAIPSHAAYTVSWVEQRGVGPLTGSDAESPDKINWLPRPGGGIVLQNGKEFIDEERYWLYFEPTIDGNVAAAIQDVLDLLEAHIQDKNNPHAVTKDQVGLGNIPNATSNSYQLNDPNTLATSKAVHDLWQSITGTILLADQYLVGDVPAQTDRLYTIPHSLNLAPDSYMVIGTLLGYSADFNRDNDVTWVTRNMGANSFELAIHNLGNLSAGLVFHYIIVNAE